MDLERILERNRSFVRGRPAKPLSPPERIQLVVISCYDPRLDDLIVPALGLAPGEAFLLRTAGAVVSPRGDPIRSLAVSLFLFDVSDVIVLGHSSCRMSQFDTATFVDSFRRRGVARDAFGTEDLRTWAGAIPTPRAGVQTSVAVVSSAPFLPSDVTVTGMVLDDTTGGIEVIPPVERTVAIEHFFDVPSTGPPTGRLGIAGEPVAGSGPGDTPAGQTGATATEEGEAAAGERAGSEGESGRGRADRAADALSREADAILSFLKSLQSKAHWRDDLQKLQSDLSRQRNPILRLAMIEKLLKRAAGDSREITRSLEDLKKEVLRDGRTVRLDDVLSLLDRLTGRDRS